MLEYRITKYDPAFRDASGRYTREDWTAVSDIGRSFQGVVLTQEDYQGVEDAHVTTALAFLREAGLAVLRVDGLENPAKRSLPFADGDSIGFGRLGDVVRRVLREEFWCRLQGDDAFIHFGWDYVMYLGVPRPCPGALAEARSLGLFVEEMSSPYREDLGD